MNRVSRALARIERRLARQARALARMQVRHAEDYARMTSQVDALGAPKVVRLSVNLAPGVAHALKSTARRKDLSITEAVRHAIAIWKLVTDEVAQGRKVYIVEGRGDDATYREVVIW